MSKCSYCQAQVKVLVQYQRLLKYLQCINMALIASCKNCHKIFQRKSNVALHLDSLEASLINALFSKRLPNVYNVLNNCQLSTSYQLMENIASIASIASVMLYFSLTDGLCKGKGSTI